MFKKMICSAVVLLSLSAHAEEKLEKKIASKDTIGCFDRDDLWDVFSGFAVGSGERRVSDKISQKKCISLPKGSTAFENHVAGGYPTLYSWIGSLKLSTGENIFVYLWDWKEVQ